MDILTTSAVTTCTLNIQLQLSDMGSHMHKVKLHSSLLSQSIMVAHQLSEVMEVWVHSNHNLLVRPLHNRMLVLLSNLFKVLCQDSH